MVGVGESHFVTGTQLGMAGSSGVLKVRVLAVLGFLFQGISLFAVRLKPCELAGQLYILDVPKSELPLWLCIADFESRFNTHVVGQGNSDGSRDYGIFQISDRFWCAPPNKTEYYAFNDCNVNCSSLLSDDITMSVKCARLIQKRQGWSAWSVYSEFCNGTLDAIPQIASNQASWRTTSTSPGALQDVTMENSYASFDPSRPPGGSHSPMAVQGRSVRELEEQMSTLRKENFNLKLRIYFMEEGQPGARSNHNGESASKQLIESKIEVEVLRKTVEEKTELLKDAARAISHHEEIQRKADMESQAMIDHLQEQIRGYQAASRAGNPSAVIDAEKLRRLEQEIQRLENELLEGDMRHTAAKSQLEFALAERLDSLMACEAKIEELAIKNAELVERLQKDTESSEAANETIVKLRAELGGCHDENGRLTNAVSAAETELKRQNNSIREATDTLDVQRKAIQLMEGNIKHKDANYSRLLGSVLDYEALIAKQTTEMDSLRQEIQYYRDLTENLQQKVQMQRLERVAIVQPMRTVADAGVGIERSGSSTSLNSNFSSLSVLCGRRGPVRESLCQWSAAQVIFSSDPDAQLLNTNHRPQQQQQQRQTHQQQPQPLQQLPVNRQPTHLPTSIHSSRRQRYPGGHAALLTVAAPSTAFYNYSLPSLTGFRQFLWRWGTSPSN
ncbi:uncharacterized protein Dana_GF11185, isoform C [Drosophila ananassae]|uniref:lysozyme n=1 Tax=Drosophila ananassae TaxID=7217 RepID=A0A0P8XRA8_DROAN|nr:centrosomin isoform X8 [Drosophila ananassae]KPU77088.1 uncharacterized protein Dana_GF11185, isoform C [Drosophila ananassae]